MAKITALPRLAAEAATGNELMPVVHSGETKGVAVIDVVTPAAKPFMDGAQLARDQAADLVLPKNIFFDLFLEDAEAMVPEGTIFKLVNSTTGTADVRRRDAVGSTRLYTEATTTALRSNDPLWGAGMVGAPGAGTVGDRLAGSVTPESYAYGATVGDGTLRLLSSKYATLVEAQTVYPHATSLEQSIDWAAFQAAVNSGHLVRTRYAANYISTDEITPPAGKALVIRGECWGSYSTIRAAPGFKGWLLKPSPAYDIRDLRVIGNSEDDCFLIGSNANLKAGGARIERVYIANADIGIHFDTLWEHPWGLYYNQIIGVNFRTGGINLGGVTGDASSGESAWSMDNININGSPDGTGIAATDVVVTANSPDTTHDLVTWNNAVTPIYGWCVMRSADGVTGWHVPPNWASHAYTSGSFSAQKNAGETWFYAPVRMTLGLNIRRGKTVAMGVVQSEYFGVGVAYRNGFSAAIQQFYAETRDRVPPLSQYAGIIASGGNLSVGGGWVEQYGYGAISTSNGNLNMLGGRLRANNCKWGPVGIGGSTQQTIIHAILDATGTTPSKLVALAGSAFGFIRAGYERDSAGTSMRHYVDGLEGAAKEVRNRGTTVARLYANSAREGVVEAHRGLFTLPSKSLTPLLANVAQTTVLTPGAATACLTISGLASNTFAGLVLRYTIGILSGTVRRQTVSGTIEIALVEAAGTGVTAAIVATPTAKAIQAASIANDPVFTVSVSAGVVTISCNLATALATPAASIGFNFVSVEGSGGAALSVTQL
jgi:hypothetical protein